MRIVYIITRSDAVGGASIHVRDMARYMFQQGHDARVLIGGEGPVTDQLASAGVPYESLRWLQRAVHPWRDLRALAELVRTLRRLQPDVVSTHTAKAGFLGRAACRWLGIPVLYTPHGWPGDRQLFLLMERLAARWADRIICVCQDELRVAREKGIGRPEQFLVIPNGVHDVAPELRAHPDQTTARICSVARFDAPKDHETLLRAMALLQDLDWDLDLVGDGPLESPTRELARTLGLAGRVHFLGYLPDPAPVLAASQVFVLSSRSEAFPRSILEALRAGLPVVATQVGGVAEFHCCKLTPAGDAGAMAAATRSLLLDKDLRVQQGAAARAEFERSYRFEITAARTESVYATVQVRTARPRRPVNA